MNRLKLFSMVTLVALALTACDEAEVVTPPPPPPPSTGTIGGLVLIEGTGATGVTVTLSTGTTTQTGAGGVFAFQGVLEGSYSVSISGYPEDVTFTSTTQLAAINSDGQVVNLNFNGSYIRTSSIIGAVVVENRAGRHTMGMDGTGGLAGVTVRLGGSHAMGESTKTGSQGSFAFTGLRAGSYTVTLSGLPSNVRFESNEMSVDVGVGDVGEANFEDGTFYYEEGTLRGRLYIDGNENDNYEMGVDGMLALDSVTITLEGGTVGMQMTAMTDSTGSFEFTYLEEGTYRVLIDSKDAHLKDQNVQLRGTGQSKAIEVRGNSVANAYFGFDVQKFMAMVPVVYGTDGDTENPAEGIEVMLWTQPKGVSGRKQVGKTAKSDSMGIATVEIARATLKDLPAQSIVFAEVQDPTANDADPDNGFENDRDPVDDEVVTFTLDKSQFSTTAPEDHNLLWRNITVVANYVDLTGKPVLKSLTADSDPTIPFLGDFWYKAKASTTAWSALPSGVSDTNKDDVDPVRITDKKSAHNGAYQVQVVLNQVGLDNDDDNTNTSTYPAFGQYGVIDVTNPTAQNLVFREKGATEDSTRTGVTVVSAKGTGEVKYAISDDTFTGTAKRALLSGAVDGSSKEVFLGNFLVSYPHPDVTFTVYNEKNDIPGYQDSKANKDNPDALGLEANTTAMGFTLRFTGAGLDDDSHGDITCTVNVDENSVPTGVITCPNAPANADSWSLLAVGGLNLSNTPPTVYSVEDAVVRFMPMPGVLVQTHADSAATAAASGPVTNTMYTASVSAIVEALTGVKLPGILGWKHQNQIMTLDVVNTNGVVASTAKPTANNDTNTGVAKLTVTAVLDSAAAGYNAARDTVLEGKTSATGQVTFGTADRGEGLVEGPYTVTITKDGEKPARTIRAVMYNSKGTKRTGEANAIGYAQTLKVAKPADGNTSAHFQEVEFQGSISGYVFNAANHDNQIATWEQIGAGYGVMAQRMKPNSDGNCTVPDTDNRKKDGDPIAVSTNEKGVYTFALWEGCYDIMTDTTYTAQPDEREGFTVSETSANLTRAATASFNAAFNDGNGDTDFEVIQSNGQVVVQVRLLSNNVQTDTAVANMNVYLFQCKLAADRDKISDATLAFDTCDAANERTAVKGDGSKGYRTTASDGTATWTGLPEGWYLAQLQSPTTDGVEYTVGGAQGDTNPIQVFRPLAQPSTDYIQLWVPKS